MLLTIHKCSHFSPVQSFLSLKILKFGIIPNSEYIMFMHTTKLRVRYGETDQMGYCYYGNYAQYFEVGRVEALRAIGLSYKKLEEQGIMLPVSEFSIKYVAPAFYDDELTIQTTIKEVRGSRIYFTYETYNENHKLLNKAQTMLVFVNKETMRPVAAPAHFIELLEKYNTYEQ